MRSLREQAGGLDMLGIILVVILVLALFGSFPGGPAPWAANWGYAPMGGIGLVLIILLILLLAGRI